MRREAVIVKCNLWYEGKQSPTGAWQEHPILSWLGLRSRKPLEIVISDADKVRNNATEITEMCKCQKKQLEESKVTACGMRGWDKGE